MEEDVENSKESSHSAHADGLNKLENNTLFVYISCDTKYFPGFNSSYHE
jgi:hypothetical protein